MFSKGSFYEIYERGYALDKNVGTHSSSMFKTTKKKPFEFIVKFSFIVPKHFFNLIGSLTGIKR